MKGKKAEQEEGIDLTSSRSVDACPVSSATEAAHINKRKIDIYKDQNDDWSHFLVPRFGPTVCSHRPTFRGDLVKIGRESKFEENSTPIGN